MGIQNKVVLESPQVKNGNKLYCRFSCSGKVGRYFKEKTFYMEINENIGSVPKSILLIPVLSNICPVAWIAGADIYVEEIDQQFLEALNVLKNSFQKLYPKHSFKGNIKYKKIKKNKGYGKKKSGLFFSGGVDSIASYIRKSQENPYLLTVKGADIPLSEKEGWTKVKNHTKQFAKEHRLTPFFIQTNLRSFLNESNLNKDYAKQGLRGWWGGVQHGLGLVGLSAPLTFIKGIDKIHFASTPLLSNNNNLYSTSWGSHPLIENNIKWGETKVILDGTKLNRFDKIKIITDYIKKKGSKLQLRVCWESKKGQNCGKCEKCARTMANLLAEGVNPSNHGFRMNAKLLQYMKKNKKSFMKLNKVQWKILQKKLSAKMPNQNSEYYNFCQWIVKVNFQRRRKDFFS